MIQSICRFLLRCWGFTIIGPNPEIVPKKVYAVYPHTSNWDFVLGILVKFAMPIKVNYVAKNSLFRFPFGWIFTKLGGFPVDRSKSTHFVETMVEQYAKYDKVAFAIAPEGTRKKVSKFKSGFYFIAVKAKVPIILVKFDFGNKLIDYSKPFYPTGVYKDDLKFIIQHFEGTKGKNPEFSGDWEDETFD